MFKTSLNKEPVKVREICGDCYADMVSRLPEPKQCICHDIVEGEGALDFTCVLCKNNQTGGYTVALCQSCVSTGP